jgi:hypothetical protein
MRLRCGGFPGAQGQIPAPRHPHPGRLETLRAGRSEAPVRAAAPPGRTSELIAKNWRAAGASAGNGGRTVDQAFGVKAHQKKICGGAECNT